MSSTRLRRSSIFTRLSEYERVFVSVITAVDETSQIQRELQVGLSS